mgnify:CR=1 FL=1
MVAEDPVSFFGYGAEYVRTVASACSATMAVLGIPIFLLQVRQRSAQQRMWATVDACKLLETNTELCRAAAKLREASEKGTSYTKETLDEAKTEIVTLLNFLDGIAIGVTQGIYEKKIAEDNLGPHVKKYVEVFLLQNTSSEADDPESWTAEAGVFPFLEKPEVAFENLLSCYREWTTRGKKPKTRFKKVW